MVFCCDFHVTESELLMTTNQTPPSSKDIVRKVLSDFRENVAVIRDCKALAIGIDKQFFERYPDISRKNLRNVLSIHTNSLRYLRAMAKATHRHDIDDNPVAEVTPEHHEYAVKVLQERTELEEERRKAKRQAEKQQRKASEKLRREDEEKRKAEALVLQRQEKLTQLTAKFSRNS